MSSLLKNKTLLVVLVLVTAGAGFVYGLRGKVLGGGTMSPTGKVKIENLIQRVTIAGSAEPVRSTVVTAPYDGYVKKLFVKLGQKVKAGDPIVSIAQSLQAGDDVFPLRSPFTGTVTQVLKSEGEYVKQNDFDNFVLRIDDLTKMYIHAKAPEIDVVKIKDGMESVIKVSAILSRNYNGSVREISQAATNKENWGGRGQVDYLVKIEVTDADRQLRPGMSAVIDIIAGKKDKVPTLAHEFIEKDGDKYFVVMKDGGRRQIKVGLQNETVFEIVSGLKEGDEVRQVDFLKLVESQK
jgi:multidrug efflux pump subunit AcrA (membrane-fusion protein)